MRIKKLKHSVVDLNLKQSKNKYAIDTASEDPKLPALFVFCGSRGSGKTYACVAMCKHFKRRGTSIGPFSYAPPNSRTMCSKT